MSNGKKIYIAGPMHGIEDYNIPAFDGMAEYLKGEGWIVFNPANHGPEEDNFIAIYSKDIIDVINSDAIFMLKGWEDSYGACGEHAVALAVKSRNPAYQIIYE